MEEELRALLKSDAAVMAAAGGQVNWGAHPQGADWPGLVLTIAGDAEGYHYEGPDGLSVGRVQADAYAASIAGAKALGRAVRAVLSGHRDGRIRGVFHVVTRDMGREGEASEADRPFRISQDFMIHWRTT